MFIIKSNGWNQFTLFCKSRDFSRFTKKRGIFINECTNSFLSKIAFFKSIAFSKAHCIVQNNMHQFKCLTIAYKKINSICTFKAKLQRKHAHIGRGQTYKEAPTVPCSRQVKICSLNNFASNVTFLFSSYSSTFAFFRNKAVHHLNVKWYL